MVLKKITSPTVEPITLSDVEGQCRATLTGEEASVNTMIAAVRQKAENILHRAFITQTWDMVLDEFTDVIEVSKPPLVSVASVKYYDPDGILQTLAATEYVIDTDSTPGRVYPAYGKSWPATQVRPNAVRIQFVAGYGDAGTDVPACIRQWMLLNVTNLYENRETETVASGKLTMVDLSTLADSLLDPERWQVQI